MPSTAMRRVRSRSARISVLVCSRCRRQSSPCSRCVVWSVCMRRRTARGGPRRQGAGDREQGRPGRGLHLLPPHYAPTPLPAPCSLSSISFPSPTLARSLETIGMRMLVLGAGLQGSACAYDLLQNPDVSEVRLADLHVERLPEFLAPYSGKRLIPTRLDVRDAEAVRAVMAESNAVMSAIPYYFNFELARHAAEVGVHFCDLGGNTEIVFQQKALDPIARERNITIVPDCGLAPGMVNILAQHGIQQLDKTKSVRIYVGGLPQNPEP